MTVTIRDIAEAAGVSIGTVSRALKNQRGLSDDTRRLVRRLARELGYDAARLRSTRSQRLVFLLHRQHSSFASNPFFSYVMHGVEEACRDYGVASTLLTTGPTEPLRDQLRLHEPDAVIAAGYFEPELLNLAAGLELPMALVDSWMPDRPAVNPDNVLGGFLAARHLLETGRRRIAYIAGSLAHHSLRERAHGYRRALFEAGMLADPDLEVVAPPGVDPAEGAALAMRQLLKLRRRPDAVFACNDMVALAALQVCRQAGLQVPQDVALVGFDDIPAAAAATPALSTLRVDKQALGRAGVDLVMRGHELPQQMVLPVELVVRASSVA